ncbi:GNAT family N-acetyltransferase [Streptomyces sp. NPDC006207]
MTGWGRTQRADGDLDRYRSGLATPQFNGVVRVRSLDAVAQAVTAARTELAGVPWWWAGPDSPEGTPAALTRHGAVPLGALPLMVRPLDRAPAPQDPPAGLGVEAVETPDRPAELVGTYRTSMGFAPELQPGLVRSEARRADNADIVRLAAVLDGDVVGTTVLITAHDVAGIFLVHVAAPHRRRGIGAALTSAALDVAHDRGTHLAALIASPSGEPLYRRFTTVSEYRLFTLPA